MIALLIIVILTIIVLIFGGVSYELILVRAQMLTVLLSSFLDDILLLSTFNASQQNFNELR